MKRHRLRDDLPGWIGSSPNDFLMGQYDPGQEMSATEWKRLNDIRAKLRDPSYMDGAIARIAEMLSNKAGGSKR